MSWEEALLETFILLFTVMLVGVLCVLGYFLYVCGFLGWTALVVVTFVVVWVGIHWWGNRA